MWTISTWARKPPKIADILASIVLLALASLAWLVLYIWSASPFAQYLDHGVLADLPQGEGSGYLELALLFVFGWTLMTVAMMLPTSLPLISLFAGMVRRRSDATQLVALLLTGYLAIWLLFGVVAHLGDWMLHRFVARHLWLALHPWAIAAGVFFLAGLYQFTPLKYHCLDKCRSPLSFVMGHWHGIKPLREAWMLGVRHGLFCLGCCWALMLLMFAVGMGNLGWMLALGVVMALEKNLPWGYRIGKPLGVALLVFAVGMVLANRIQ